MRLIAFITLVFLSTLLPWYVFAVFVIAYSLVWNAFELLILSVAIDAYFGSGVSFPYYTIATLGALLVIEWSKPKLLIYNR